MQPIIHTASGNCSICFKQKKPRQTKQHQKNPSQKEGQAVKGVPQQGVELLLTRYQQMGCQSIPCHTALRVWTQQEGKHII